MIVSAVKSMPHSVIELQKYAKVWGCQNDYYGFIICLGAASGLSMAMVAIRWFKDGSTKLNWFTNFRLKKKKTTSSTITLISGG